MRRRDLLFACAELLLIVALTSLGALFLSLYFLPHMRGYILELFLGNDRLFLSAGALFLSLGILLSLLFGMTHRGHFVKIGMGGFVEEGAVRQLIETFWKKELSSYSLPSQIRVEGGRIEIFVPMPLEEEGLKAVEDRLAALFSTAFGKRKPFFLYVTAE